VENNGLVVPKGQQAGKKPTTYPISPFDAPNYIQIWQDGEFAAEPLWFSVPGFLHVVLVSTVSDPIPTTRKKHPYRIYVVRSALSITHAGAEKHSAGFSNPIRFLSFSLDFAPLLRSGFADQGSHIRPSTRAGRTSTRLGLINMNADDNEISVIANIEMQILQGVMISRYFAAAGLVLVLYDAILTIDDEVSKYLAQALELHSLSAGPPGLARAFETFEGTLLHQPVLDDRVFDSCQLSWVTSAQEGVWDAETGAV
jgi:hypothetical protein